MQESSCPLLRNLKSTGQIAAHHPAFDMVWGTMDGLKCQIENAPDDIVQARFDFIMVVSQTILCLLSCVSSQMVPSQLDFSTYPNVVTTAPFQIGEISTSR